jgi:hypothetical protein
VLFPISFSGFDGGLHGGCTSLFETQVSEAAMEDCVVEISPDKTGSLAGVGVNTGVASGPVGGKEAAPSSSREVLNLDDDDDFVTPVVPPVSKRTRSAVINRPTGVECVVVSNNRAVERPVKLRCSMEKLKPSRFRHLNEARQIKDLILSQDFRTKYKE